MLELGLAALLMLLKVLELVLQVLKLKVFLTTSLHDLRIDVLLHVLNFTSCSLTLLGDSGLELRFFYLVEVFGLSELLFSLFASLLKIFFNLLILFSELSLEVLTILRKCCIIVFAETQFRSLQLLYLLI